MEAEDQAVGVAGVIVVGDVEGVLAAVDGLDARRKSGGAVATAGGLGDGGGCEGRERKKSLGCH